MSEAVVVNDSNFQQLVIDSKTPVMVDVWAPWCRPCRMVAPILDELANEYQDRITLAKLNVDENAKTATKYRVMSIPNLIIFKKGEPVSQIVGYKPKRELKKDLDTILG